MYYSDFAEARLLRMLKECSRHPLGGRFLSIVNFNINMANSHLLPRTIRRYIVHFLNKQPNMIDYLGHFDYNAITHVLTARVVLLTSSAFDIDQDFYTCINFELFFSSEVTFRNVSESRSRIGFLLVPPRDNYGLSRMTYRRSNY